MGIEDLDLTSDGRIKKNVGGSDHFIRSKTTARLRKFWLFEKLAQILPKENKEILYTILKKSFIGKNLDKQYELKLMLPSTREKLLEYFRPHNENLEKLLSVNLDRWNE